MFFALFFLLLSFGKFAINLKLFPHEKLVTNYEGLTLGYQPHFAIQGYHNNAIMKKTQTTIVSLCLKTVWEGILNI